MTLEQPIDKRLFDVDRDPAETNDLADRDPESARWYRQRLRQWSAAQKARGIAP